MLLRRPSEERGKANFSWLESWHGFSFGHYYDPNHMGFGPLRVINGDRVDPGRGFLSHGHRDMEIISSYVLSGALEHRDTLGNGERIVPGQVQRMSAGTGIRHSEMNASRTDPVHFLQIWIEPDQTGLSPGYEQKAFSAGEKRGQLRLVGSREGREGSVTIHQDVDMYAGLFAKDEQVSPTLAGNRIAWIHLVHGKASVNDIALSAGDGLALSDQDGIKITGLEESEILLFDMGSS